MTGVQDSIRATLRSAVMLLGVFLLGTVGYRGLGGADFGWVDALYMTTITLTTVGYGETIPVAGRPVAQVFTVFLLLSGAGTFVYFFSNLTAFLVEGTVQQVFRRRHMERSIERLEQHHVVCGAGHSAEAVVQELLATGRPLVVVEENAERVEALVARLGQDFPLVVGDATEDDVLQKAGVDRAQSLVSCIGNDKDNVLVVFTARALNPNLRIVARCLEAAYEPKLRRAGADAVVSPERIGGLRLVSETVRPTVVSFLDQMLREGGNAWRVEEVVVGAGSDVEGTTVAAVRERGFDLLVMAVRSREGEWAFNPPDSLALTAGAGVIFLGSPDGRASLEVAARA
ncbi:MAG: potassium channel protein [Deltaproteobacteria bacterium]|nr:potassium channel protein [Deltaproteobacteria bacterium]MBW2447379.1 potassium channel protein [Deltaproteobacteria bacterium]